MTLGSSFTAASYLVGGLVLYFEARRRKLATEGMGYIALAAIFGGAFGAKLTYWVIFNWPGLSSHPSALLDPRLGGRALIGGLVGGWLAVELVKWRLGIKRPTGDMFALALCAGEAVGRFGCFFNQCCYGACSHLPWAVYQHDALRHPTQIYSSLVAAALFGVLFYLRDKMPREGDLFRLYLVLYGVSRFLLEFLRERNAMIAGLSLVQWVCLEMVVLFSITLIVSHYRSQGVMKRAM